jgi:hypothetical protein
MTRNNECRHDPYRAYTYIRDTKSEALEFGEVLANTVGITTYVYYDSPDNVFVIARRPVEKALKYGLSLIYRFV